MILDHITTLAVWTSQTGRHNTWDQTGGFSFLSLSVERVPAHTHTHWCRSATDRFRPQSINSPGYIRPSEDGEEKEIKSLCKPFFLEGERGKKIIKPDSQLLCIGTKLHQVDSFGVHIDPCRAKRLLYCSPHENFLVGQLSVPFFSFTLPRRIHLYVYTKASSEQNFI